MCACADCAQVTSHRQKKSCGPMFHTPKSKDIQIAKANKKYTQLIKQQKTNYISSGKLRPGWNGKTIPSQYAFI